MVLPFLLPSQQPCERGAWKMKCEEEESAKHGEQRLAHREGAAAPLPPEALESLDPDLIGLSCSTLS